MNHPASPGAPPAEWLEAALAVANIPTLACLLVQLTGDRRWIEGRFVPERTRGLDDNDDGGLPGDVQEEIRRAARAAIEDWFAGRPPALTDPADELLCELMGVSLGDTIPAEYAAMIRHELQLPEPGSGSEAGKAAVPPGFSALIVGAGISGLCAAMAFAQAGIPYTILERGESVGGVWFENRYPGAACDVPSHLYSFSFAPYRWSRYFAGSREIHSYLKDFAERNGIVRNIRFGLEVEEATYLESEGKWRAVTLNAAGGREVFAANILISGVGAFNKPRLPDLPGMERFKGPSMHTARYPDEGLDLKGRRVVLVGNGASAMQVAPAIAGEVAALTIVQRTPQWVAPFPKFGCDIPEPLQQLLERMPLYRRWYRLRLSWAFNDKLYDALQKDPEWTRRSDSINAINDTHRRGLTAYMEAELGEAKDLMPKVLPDYPPFGKRMLLDNGWFRTLSRPNVHLVIGGVTEVGEDRVFTSDGGEHEADAIIWATGFDVVNLLAPMRVKGVGGRELHAEWEGDNARAYLGTVVPGFPNFFCLYGPNTQFGHGGSLISVLERQMHYIMSLLNQMFENALAVVDVRRDTYEDYNERVDQAHSRMIWTLPNVSGYYRNSRGRIVVNNPFRILEVWQMTERADLADFHCLAVSDFPASGRRAVESSAAT
ncbi:NAD(P)-binding domain-containing protein [Tsuneonella sp. CC-YZS046]|uniref:flavin-containing monooxygenase n=1 Tax=Tsuneonella sp. CC-YZS046 TaxID=3042152 RepID=UPI002D77CE5F|nr:NAD(P)-binding domain-containing protein [Tsuneonella sp. CC-YZS046]WRO66746.1 NAD(P)-binding domain-containing protein [Tsuneonella sp. CC-YZS046]